MTFDPKKHIIRIQGNREYLPVAARLIWFRQDHPDWGIVTNPVDINMEKQYAIFSCSIFNEDGKVMATATKMENVRGFPDYLEKAETGSVGRALAYVGYGTQFAPELEEESRFADSPYGGGAPRPSGSGGYNGNGNGNGGYGGNGGTRPASAAPQSQNSAPARRPVPPVATDGGGGNGNGNGGAPANTNANSNGNGGVQRVREPERAAEYEAPDEEEEEDDFFDEEDGLTAAETAPVAVPATPAPSAPRANPLAGNRCSVEGCSNVLTAGQMTMSTAKFGRPVCLLHQKDVQPLANSGAPAPAAGGARRSGRGAAVVADGDGE